jgi:chromate transporter
LTFGCGIFTFDFMNMNGSKNNSTRPSLFHLFVSFLGLGATCFGGPATVAYIGGMAVEKKRWLDDETFKDGVALCQTIPGATAMQTAAYVGLRVRGPAGAAVSLIGFGLPAFVLMVALSVLYSRTNSIPAVVSAFEALRAIVVAIVANATVSFFRSSLTDWRRIIIAAGAAALFGLRVNPAFVILLAAGIGLFMIEKRIQLPEKQKPTGISRTVVFISVAVIVLIFAYSLLFFFQRPLFDLGLLMSRIDVFAFGGGYAAVPLMLHEVVDIRLWMDAKTFMDGIALGQVTPGPITITSTFVGYMLHGIPGCIVATIGMYTPSFLILVSVAPYFDILRASRGFHRSVTGILCSFVGLLLAVTVRLALQAHWNLFLLILTVAAFIALLKKVNILWVVGIGIVLSFLINIF